MVPRELVGILLGEPRLERAAALELLYVRAHPAGLLADANRGDRAVQLVAKGFVDVLASTGRQRIGQPRERRK